LIDLGGYDGVLQRGQDGFALCQRKPNVLVRRRDRAARQGGNFHLVNFTKTGFRFQLDPPLHCSILPSPWKPKSGASAISKPGFLQPRQRDIRPMRQTCSTQPGTVFDVAAELRSIVEIFILPHW